MANVCYTKYHVVGNNNEIKRLYEALEKSKIREDSNDVYLEDFVKSLGVNYDDIEVDMRYEINDFEMDENGLWIIAIYAWDENPGFIEFLETHFNGIKVYFLATEPSCGYFMTNDTKGAHFSERYYLEIDDKDSSYDTIKNMVEVVEESLGYEVAPTYYSIKDELEKAFEKGAILSYQLKKYDGFDVVNDVDENPICTLF